MLSKNKLPLIVIAALMVLSAIGIVLYNVSQPTIMERDGFFDSKYLEVEKLLNTHLDYEEFIKGDVIGHEITNGEKIVRWKDGNRMAAYITDQTNTLLMVVYISYLNDMDSCLKAYEENKVMAQKIYGTRAKAGAFDHSSILVKDKKEILLYCSKSDGDYMNMVTYRYVK